MTDPDRKREALWIDDAELITLKDASEIIFGGRVSPRYLKGEVGVTMGGWIFGKTVLTSCRYAQEFRDSIVPIGAEPINGPGVYVVGYGKYVKIGVSTKVKERIATLRTSVPSKNFKTYMVLTGDAREEQSLHRRFKAYRLNGEWFRKAGELAAWINGGFKYE